jgi:hypothetical protein
MNDTYALLCEEKAELAFSSLETVSLEEVLELLLEEF